MTSNLNEELVEHTHVGIDGLESQGIVVQESGTCIPGPPTVKFIIVNEACERFSYYALRSVLFLYLTKRLGFGENAAMSINSAFISIAYLTPLIGGYISDSYWGKFKTIFRFSTFYVISAAILAISAIGSTRFLAILGLLGIAIGTGGIKPCVSAFGADQFINPAPELFDQYFSVFYMTINVASLISFIVTPIIRTEVSYFFAFALPSLILFVSILVFLYPRTRYNHVQPTGSLLAKLWPTILYVFWTARNSENRIAEASTKFGKEEARLVEALTVVVPIFLFFPLFWTCYDLSSSAWVLQASKMELYGLQPEQIGVLNTIFILTMVPTLDRYVYPFLRKRNFAIGHLDRIFYGLCFTIIAMIIFGLVEASVTSRTVSIFAQIPQYFVLSLAEALVSVTSLAYAYQNAPDELKTVIGSLNLFMVALGDLFSAIVFGICGATGSISHLAQYVFFTILIILNTIGFRFYTRKPRAEFQRLEETDVDGADFNVSSTYPEPEAIQPL